jgi:hypothetical protein
MRAFYFFGASALCLTAAGCGSNGNSSPNGGPADSAAEASAEASAADSGAGVDTGAGETDAGSNDGTVDAPGTDSSEAVESGADATSPDEASVNEAGVDATADASPDASCTTKGFQIDPHNCGGCGIDCGSNGACGYGRCTTVLATDTSSLNNTILASGITVGTAVYVTSGSSYDCIYSIPLAGGAPTPIVSPQITPHVNGSDAVTLVGSTLYWATGGANAVYSVPAAGGASTSVALTENYPGAITNDGNNVYWTDDSRIRYTKTGTPAPATLPIVTDAGQPFENPTGIAVDATYVYWSNRGTNQGTATVWRAKKADGSSASILNTTGADAIQGMTIDATTIYFTENYGGGNEGVYSIPIGGGPITTLSSTETFPIKIVNDATAIYWTDGLRIRKMTKSLGASSVTTLSDTSTGLSGGGTFNDIAVDSTYVYFTQSNVKFAVYRVAKN